ncbi:MAG TPA: F0F1 ATP synthase subunit gamma [Acidiferrobacterales bacterium]|nr:F0F1 ATP synthase subunit gamma [Acidiferrobacterales bacterium]
MAAGKEIRNQIRSIQNTQKITRAMEMVAASKMRKAQERMRMARPYAEKIRAVIGHLHYAHPEYRHPFLLERAARRAGIIVITSDRGLCGGLNTNVLKTTIGLMREWNEQKIDIDVCTIGSKGFAFLKRVGAKIASHTSHLGDVPHVHDLIGVVKVMLDAYSVGQLDRVQVIYNRFINTMSQQPAVQQLLPLPAEEQPQLKHHWDYLYEPEAREVVDELLTRYIETLVYHAVVENIASEQSARMVAMKSASDNAGKIIGDLKLKYNKARQAAITQELSEIVGGAAAV